MDLCAEMLLTHLPGAVRLLPRFRRVATRLSRRRAALNADRLLNRFVVYPRFLTSRRGAFDCFHIVDHTYAQLVHALPPNRTGVYCHDLDAFRCLTDPRLDPRPRWFRALARRILSGLQQASVVFHSTMAVRGEIERLGLIDPNRLVHAPYGVAAEFVAAGPAESRGGRYVLHVGSNIPRKRIDVLLHTLAGVRRQLGDVTLVKVGGPFTAEQRAIVDREGLAPFIDHRAGLERTEIAALYRGAAVVLFPSEAEGFGLPVIEALACGAPVVASDLPVLREVGGGAAVFAPVGDVAAWVEVVCRVLERPVDVPPSDIRRAQASRFTWENHARIIGEAYRRLVT